MKKSIISLILAFTCLISASSLLTVASADGTLSLDEAKATVEKYCRDKYPLSQEDFDNFVSDWNYTPTEVEDLYGMVSEVIGENDNWFGFEVCFFDFIEDYIVNKHTGEVIFVQGGNDDYNQAKVLEVMNEKDTESKDDTIKIKFNGIDIPFDQPPVIIEDRTLVPLRAIFEALGATVMWDEATRTVTGEKDEIKISLTIGSTSLFVNDTPIILDVPAQIIGDRTMVPIRAIAESFNCKVDWDGETRTVLVSTND